MGGKVESAPISPLISPLVRSALGGLSGRKGTQMPPRGGNDKLTDDQVRAAVEYMIAIVR